MIGIVMGSLSDYKVMMKAEEVLCEFGVPYEITIVSAHRTPDLLFSYADSARHRGLKGIIAGAGGSAHLPGMLAAKTPLPVYAVPIKATCLDGLDSLLSIVQMPYGVPVATFAIDGAGNAALFAVQQLAVDDDRLFKRLVEFRLAQTQKVLDTKLVAAVGPLQPC
jgi:5-(carboxyamino)imidazole ribonucleotide mutase